MTEPVEVWWCCRESGHVLGGLVEANQVVNLVAPLVQIYDLLAGDNENVSRDSATR